MKWFSNAKNITKVASKNRYSGASQAMNPYYNFRALMQNLIDKKMYADAYLWLIYNKIFSGVQNVRFKLTDDAIMGGYEMYIKGIFDYMQKNLATIMYLIWANGYIAFREKGNSLAIMTDDEIEFDDNGKITNSKIVYYSNEYKTSGTSAFTILRENINELNGVKNADVFLTSTLGALGIISGKDMPFTKKDQEKLASDLKSKYGITEDKVQLLFTNNDVNFQQIDFKIDELHLDRKVKDAVMLLAGYFNIPYDLITFSDKSTYANQREAKVEFYENCISAIAKVGLEVIRKAMANHKVLIPARLFTYEFVDVPELKKDKEEEIEYLKKVADVALSIKQISADADVTNYINVLESYGKEN